MTLSEITIERYAEAFPRPATAYDSAAFIALNAHKAEAVRIAGVTDSDGRLVMAQAFGLRDGVWRAPFSAPFSAGAGGDDATRREFYREIAGFLDGAVQTAWPSACYGVGAPPAEPALSEHNFHYPLSQAADYKAHLLRSARHNHTRIMRADFRFSLTDDVERAYRVIALNRAGMGYPLAMSLDEVAATRAIIPADYMMLSLDGTDVAAAVVFRPVEGVAQVIYWGDVPEARRTHAMNRLAWEVMNHYSKTDGIHTVDIGPSSTEGVLNAGLAEFKLSIGCIDTPRPIIRLDAPVRL